MLNKKIDDKECTEKKNQFDAALIFGTSVFNEKTGRNRHVEKATQAQMDYFINPKTCLLHEYMAEYRHCPLCSSNSSKILFIKNGIVHVKCNSCSFIFVNPIPKDKFINDFFRKRYQSWTEVLVSPEQLNIDSKKFQYGLEMICSRTRRRGILVDIGAGSGLFLKLAKEFGWQVSGVEFNQKAVENIRKRGIEVFDMPLEEGIYAKKSIDVVTAWEVLESINDLNGFLTQIRKIVRDRGLLFICAANINALVTRILQGKSRTFGGYVHINFFSIETLSKLLKKHGFGILKTDTVITELPTIRNYLSFNDPYESNSNERIDFLTPEFIYKYSLGSRILMLCRKLRDK